MTAPSAEVARSFDAWADEYDRYRPGYPEALFLTIRERLRLPERPRVADLGAGTGRASLAMAGIGWRVTAVEPGGGMLAALGTAAAGAGLSVDTVQASAEATGLPRAAFDLVTAAQAFHWFDAPRAVEEIARITRRGGGVALFWNVRDPQRSPFVADYHELLRRYPAGEADRARYLRAGVASGRERTQEAFAGSERFDPLSLVELSHEVAMTASDFIGMAFTASYIRLMEPERQRRFRAELVSLLEEHRLTSGTFSLPYRIDLWTTRRSTA